MYFNVFKLERYFAKYEFSVEYLLSASDCESLTIQELLEFADPAGRDMWSNLKLGYTDSKGHPLLREEIARLYQKITPQDILAVTPEEGILTALGTILSSGDEVISVSPAYQSLLEIPRAIGCRVISWPLEVIDGNWALDLRKLADNITTKTKLLIINFPHNPTGFLPPLEFFNGLVNLARTHNLYIFSDEMYWMLEHDPALHLPAIADYYEKGVSLFGLSKTFGLPGLRIGWLATQDKALLSRFAIFKDYTTICSSAPSEVLALIALRAKESLIRRSLKLVKDNLKLADDFFTEYSRIFQLLPPQGGSVAFPKLTLDLPVADFCNDIVLKNNLMILPGTVFDFTENHFRLGLGRKDFAKALERLACYIKNNL